MRKKWMAVRMGAATHHMQALRVRYRADCLVLRKKSSAFQEVGADEMQWTLCNVCRCGTSQMEDRICLAPYSACARSEIRHRIGRGYARKEGGVALHTRHRPSAGMHARYLDILPIASHNGSETSWSYGYVDG